MKGALTHLDSSSCPRSCRSAAQSSERQFLSKTVCEGTQQGGRNGISWQVSQQEPPPLLRIRGTPPVSPDALPSQEASSPARGGSLSGNLRRRWSCLRTAFPTWLTSPAAQVFFKKGPWWVSPPPLCEDTPGALRPESS